MADPLSEYRVKARNTSAQSENKIHDDTVARQYGFRGGLVPGVTVYAYLIHPLVQALGRPWLERGTATVKFLKPIFAGEEVTIAGEITERATNGLRVFVRATTEASGECAVLTATLPAGLPTPVNPALYRAAPLPGERPAVSREHLAGLEVLGSPEVLVDEDGAATYLESIAEDLPIFRSREGWVHPAVFLQQANRAVDRNVRLGPWVHVTSTVRHLGGARVGETVRTLGRIRSLWEKKGREYVEVDLFLVAGAKPRPVAHVLHTTIWRLPPP